ncbi:DUF2157 domain-containing protein [Flavobacterium sp. NKUCC04_CG]|uniref:DUF2157 domain-containing protein n=1 Tax=Flavobacterium sp. NKUCC04_CG TaxID=2842121 RepID=UPI001C5B13AC|nr:DUF2157 domain-containing protein [Flavobacterium sp. NKUCC04_CG]MBW3518309.1 DUF2157 domain-containing protein [Flavobacterium sp. NKUCC04_CG]
MKNHQNAYTKKLLDKQLLTATQFDRIEAYRKQNIFSVRNELKTLLYVAVLLFTAGFGMLIYQNIDTIGHMSVLALLLIITAVCFYFAFKNSSGFKRTETVFENSVYDYVVLAGISLLCIFIGYLQFQYHTFGTHYGLATLLPTFLSIATAYYFDNKSALTIGITGLAAYVGLTISPQALIHNDFYDNTSLSYSAILLGILLVFWTLYASKVDLKRHFNFVYLTFALHLISLALLSNLFKEQGLWYIIPLIASSYYFYRESYKNASITLLVFTVLYAYIGFTVFTVRVIESSDIFMDSFESLLMISPFYIIGLIVLFVRLIKNFNKKIADERI